MIDEEGKGMLVDWDFSKPREVQGPRPESRTVGSLNFSSNQLTGLLLQGTWQFVSAARLTAPGTAPHLYEDDLESFLYVMAWVSLTYMANRDSPQSRFHRLLIFDEFMKQDGHQTGGQTKLQAMKAGAVLPKNNFLEPKVYPLVNGLAGLFTSRYVGVSENLESFEKFGSVFTTLLGKKSGWEHGSSPAIQPVDSGLVVSAKQMDTSTVLRNIRLKGYWPEWVAPKITGTVPISCSS